MNRIFFMYNNLIDSAALTESSQADGFPAENVQQPFRTKVWRTEGAVAGTANLVIDHGSAKAVNCVALTGYNWAAAPATLDLEFNATDAWATPAAAEALTWAVTPTANGNKATIVKQFTTQTYRYNRLNVAHGPGDWDLGRIFLGEHFTPTLPFASKVSQNMVDPSRLMSTIGGQDHADVIEEYRDIKFSMVVRTQAQWELFQTMINNVGRHKDLFIAFDYDGEPDEMTIYGKFTKLPGMKIPVVLVFEMGFGFGESR